MKKSAGFSILEISITLTIIALIVAAVTAGKNIKDRLELNQVVDGVGNISTAVATFKATYGNLPGDIFNAEETFGQTETNCGNGNNAIESSVTGVVDGASGAVNETLLFWQHLALAGLIDGTYDGTTSGVGGLMQGPLKYSFYTVSKATASGKMAITVSKSGSVGLFTTKQGFDYDTKYDDGNPSTGNIRGIDGTGETAGDCNNAGAYKLSNSSEAPCVMVFYIEQ